MSELSETKACELIARLFKARGYSIARNLMFHEYGVSFHIDGWDAKARVGFEFLTSEDDDHDDLSLAEYKALMDAQHRGEVSLFIIDEVEPLSAADLTATVHEFLDEVALAARTRQAAARKKAARAATKRATARAVKKPARAAAAKAGGRQKAVTARATPRKKSRRAK